MSRRAFVQIVPTLPPETGGVGDFSLAVGRVLRTEFGIETVFVVADGGRRAEEVEDFFALHLAERSEENLAAALRAVTHGEAEPMVLLQLSGYGYSRRGCPYWLLQGLRRWKRQRPSARLVTMFHELYATAPPWRKTFWATPAQRMVLAGIARLSDLAVTSIGLHSKSLERLDRSKEGKVEVLAIASTVGEPASPPELSARARSIVVFGLPASRKRSYQTRLAELQRACEELRILEVHDVGQLFDGIPERIGQAPVTKHGHMDAEELSSLLSQSIVGFVDYLPGSMAKSSVFAAYCAHRMVPVAPEHSSPDADGLRRGVNYYSVGTQDASKPETEALQAIADAALQWYRGHSLERYARILAEFMRTTDAAAGAPKLSMTA